MRHLSGKNTGRYENELSTVKTHHTLQTTWYLKQPTRKQGEQGETALLLGAALKRIRDQTEPLYLIVIEEKATPVSQTKDTFLQRNKIEITHNSNQAS